MGGMVGKKQEVKHGERKTRTEGREREEGERQGGEEGGKKGREEWRGVGGENYSIADIACWPWVNAWTRQRIDLAMYPAVKNWHERIRSRPATGQALLKAQLGDERSDS